MTSHLSNGQDENSKIKSNVDANINTNDDRGKNDMIVHCQDISQSQAGYINKKTNVKIYYKSKGLLRFKLKVKIKKKKWVIFIYYV